MVAILFLGKTVLATDALQLSALSGKAPFKVEIKGPVRLTKLGLGQYAKFVGCGFDINWGDGQSTSLDLLSQSCSNGLNHTYQSPGVYTIKAKTYVTRPDDSYKDDWSSQLTVMVK